MANAAEQAAARLAMGIAHGAYPAGILRQVGVGDDTRDFGTAVAVARLRDAGHEFRLADRAQVFGTVLPVLRPALDEDSLHDVVPGLGVGPEILQHVSAPPHVVMRIDDGPFRIDDLFGDLSQPGCLFYRGHRHELRFSVSPWLHSIARRAVAGRAGSYRDLPKGATLLVLLKVRARIQHPEYACSHVGDHSQTALSPPDRTGRGGMGGFRRGG